VICSVHTCTISYKYVIVFVTRGNECIFVYTSPFKSTRNALSIGGTAAILASICHPSSFLLNTLGLSDSRILYLITLAEWARPLLIVVALIALFFAYLRIWHTTSGYKVNVIPQVKVTDKVFFLFVAMLVLIILMLPYFAPCL